MCACVRVRVCACAGVRVCACAGVRVHVCVCGVINLHCEPLHTSLPVCFTVAVGIAEQRYPIPYIVNNAWHVA